MKENIVESSVSNVAIPDLLIGSSSPHIRTEETVDGIMLDVIIALVPAMLGSIYFFGMEAAKVLILSIGAAVISEALIQKVFKREVTIKDLSAVVTGILLAFNLPSGVAWYIPIFGSVFAIVIVKQLFGGIGHNFMNPALAGRAALVSSWPAAMTTFIAPKAIDATTAATPLALMESGGTLPSVMDMFMGNIPGSLGETSALLLLIGAAYLLYKGVIDFKIPVIYIGTTVVMLFALGVEPGLLIYHVLGGGLILGAFFMATDYASVPVSSKGKVIFAVGAGLLTAIIRIKGGYPEGVSYSILLMNVATPVIERYTAPKLFGRVD